MESKKTFLNSFAYLAHARSVTMPASLLFEHNQPKQNAPQNHLDLIYKRP